MHPPAWLILIRFFQAVRHPVRVNQIPRQIPPGPKYLKPWVGFLFIYKDGRVSTDLHPCYFQVAALLSGILPFGKLTHVYLVMYLNFFRCRFCWALFRFILSFCITGLLRVWFFGLDSWCGCADNGDCFNSLHLFHVMCRGVQVWMAL
jgi:hypothetical protein